MCQSVPFDVHSSVDTAIVTSLQKIEAQSRSSKMLRTGSQGGTGTSVGLALQPTHGLLSTKHSGLTCGAWGKSLSGQASVPHKPRPFLLSGYRK